MSLDLQLEMLNEQGYVLLPGVLEPLRIALLRCAIDDLQPIHWDYQGLLEHYKCVFNRNPLWLPFLDLPPLIALAEAALGTDCHVIGQTAWRSHPGYAGMALHLDHLPMQLPDWLSAKGDFTQPAQILTAQLYLSDIDHNIGPTWIVPGSHQRRGHHWLARINGKGVKRWQCCARQEMRWSFAAMSGTAAEPIAARLASATCCKFITAGAWSRRSSRRT